MFGEKPGRNRSESGRKTGGIDFWGNIFWRYRHRGGILFLGGPDFAGARFIRISPTDGGEFEKNNRQTISQRHVRLDDTYGRCADRFNRKSSARRAACAHHGNLTNGFWQFGKR